MSRLPRPLLYYGSAVVSVVLATLLRMLLNPVLGQQAPFATFFLATLAMAWFAEVEARDGNRLRWKLYPFDVEAAERFFPVEIPPGHTYVDAWYESRPSEDKRRMAEHASREVRAGRSYRPEFRYRRRDGELRWL